MKKIASLTLALIVTFAFVTIAGAQKAVTKTAAGLLYEISGNKLARPSYIFGTFHFVCSTEMLPMEKIMGYIDTADQTIMEIDMDDQTELRSMAGVTTIPGGKTLSDYLTSEQYKKVDELFQKYLGHSVDTVKTTKPSILSVMVVTSPKAIDCSTPSSYDLQIMLGSVTKKKPIIGLETVAFQSQLLDIRPLDKQAQDLYKVALDPQKSIDDLRKLTDIYKLQDVDKISDFTVKQMAEDMDFETKLIRDRNSSWIPKIEAVIKEKPTFIAVGAAHLGGENGVLALLKKKGYTLTPIRL